MTQEEIISMAREAGVRDDENIFEFSQYKYLERFAKLVVEKEREEIVQFIESTNLGSLPEEMAVQYANLLRSYATAIRSRGNQ